jgi:hypothetical protein
MTEELSVILVAAIGAMVGGAAWSLLAAVRASPRLGDRFTVTINGRRMDVDMNSEASVSAMIDAIPDGIDRPTDKTPPGGNHAPDK